MAGPILVRVKGRGCWENMFLDAPRTKPEKSEGWDVYTAAADMGSCSLPVSSGQGVGGQGFGSDTGVKQD